MAVLRVQYMMDGITDGVENAVSVLDYNSLVALPCWVFVRVFVHFYSFYHIIVNQLNNCKSFTY